jgi:hypothetical protein
MQEGSPLLLHDPFYGNTFLCCLQQHRDHEAYPSLSDSFALQRHRLCSAAEVEHVR